MEWNPLVFGLVLGHDQLVNFILHEVGFNLPELLALGLPLRDAFNSQTWSEQQLVEA